MKSIRAKWLEYYGQSSKEVNLCAIDDCALHAYAFGKRADEKRKASPEQIAGLAEYRRGRRQLGELQPDKGPKLFTQRVIDFPLGERWSRRCRERQDSASSTHRSFERWRGSKPTPVGMSTHRE